MLRYVHTNIIARDAAKLVEFYKKVFDCKSIGETRDLSGEWLDQMTGVKNSHITGEHICLPGYGEDHPTLEIFSYDMVEGDIPHTNKIGIAHLAFETDDVEDKLKELLVAGGSQYGELVKTTYEDGRNAVFVYAADPEGNIIEIQSWS
ncbi:MAG: VOC family protein [Lachnospiraceae bacterium]|nr:VOC family protein [Lachnospiraceae bacterium]